MLFQLWFYLFFFFLRLLLWNFILRLYSSKINVYFLKKTNIFSISLCTFNMNNETYFVKSPWCLEIYKLPKQKSQESWALNLIWASFGMWPSHSHMSEIQVSPLKLRELNFITWCLFKPRRWQKLAAPHSFMLPFLLTFIGYWNGPRSGCWLTFLIGVALECCWIVRSSLSNLGFSTCLCLIIGTPLTYIVRT